MIDPPVYGEDLPRPEELEEQLRDTFVHYVPGKTGKRMAKSICGTFATFNVQAEAKITCPDCLAEIKKRGL